MNTIEIELTIHITGNTSDEVREHFDCVRPEVEAVFQIDNGSDGEIISVDIEGTTIKVIAHIDNKTLPEVRAYFADDDVLEGIEEMMEINLRSCVTVSAVMGWTR